MVPPNGLSTPAPEAVRDAFSAGWVSPYGAVVASEEGPPTPAEPAAAGARPPLTHNSNSYLGPIAEGGARREVRYLDDGRRMTFYSYRAGTHMLAETEPTHPNVPQ